MRAVRPYRPSTSHRLGRPNRAEPAWARPSLAFASVEPDLSLSSEVGDAADGVAGAGSVLTLSAWVAGVVDGASFAFSAALAAIPAMAALALLRASSVGSEVAADVAGAGAGGVDEDGAGGEAGGVAVEPEAVAAGAETGADAAASVVVVAGGEACSDGCVGGFLVGLAAFRSSRCFLSNLDH